MDIDYMGTSLLHMHLVGSRSSLISSSRYRAGGKRGWRGNGTRGAVLGRNQNTVPRRRARYYDTPARNAVGIAFAGRPRYGLALRVWWAAPMGAGADGTVRARTLAHQVLLQAIGSGIRGIGWLLGGGGGTAGGCWLGGCVGDGREGRGGFTAIGGTTLGPCHCGISLLVLL
jgi:hypothetical protein